MSLNVIRCVSIVICVGCSNQENIYTDVYTSSPISAISTVSPINDPRIPASPISSLIEAARILQSGKQCDSTVSTIYTAESIAPDSAVTGHSSGPVEHYTDAQASMLSYSYAKRVLACDKPPFETRYKADQMMYTSSKLPGEADRSKVWQPMSSLRDSISFREVYRKQGFLRELPIGRQLCNILLSNNSVDMVDSMEQCNRSDVSVDIIEPVANCSGIPMDVENPMDFDVYMDDTDIPWVSRICQVDLMPGVRILVDTVKVPRLAETLQHLSQTGAGFGKILESLIAAYEDGYHMQQQQGTQNAGSSESFLAERPKKTVRFALDDAPSKPLNTTNACDPVKDTLAGVEQPSVKSKSKAGKKMPKLAKQTELKKARGSVKRVKPEQVSKLVKQTKPKNTWSAKVAPTLQDVAKLELLNQQRDLRAARRRNTSSAPVIDTCIKERSSKKRKINCEVDADQPHPSRNPKRRWVI
ncbi:hypothetical protein BDEG_27927 [Batrachochytrium dendrobatidis JEL423]|uniref:Uncharacterized protein n=1 Tax=Batrachochytrium dendrobatidis (strain JEL423) TaxID=403673 RepID=A0A177WXR8_BATDL|nr:hypothetical protein BDEG_27927 [Batrachochytrium dendrobatidis JEL423]